MYGREICAIESESVLGTKRKVVLQTFITKRLRARAVALTSQVEDLGNIYIR